MAVEARSSGSGRRPSARWGFTGRKERRALWGLFSQGLQFHSPGPHWITYPHPPTGGEMSTRGLGCRHPPKCTGSPLPRHPFPSLDVSFSDQCHLLKDKCGEQPRLTAGRKPSPLPPPPRFGSAPRRRGFAFPAGLLTQPLFSVTGLKGRSSQGRQVHTRGSSAQGPHPENEIWRKHAPAHR